MKALWSFIDGYKTYISAVVLFILGGLGAIGVLEPDSVETGRSLLDSLFVMAAGVGLGAVGHKIDKVGQKGE